MPSQNTFTTNIVTYDTTSVDFEVGGKFSCAAVDVIANYPACKFLLHEEDYVSGATWTDRVTSNVCTAGTAFVRTAEGIQRTGAITTGSALPAPGDVDFVLVSQGEFESAAIVTSLGDTSAGTGIGMKGGTGEYVTGPGAAVYATTTALSGVTYPLKSMCGHCAVTGDDFNVTAVDSLDATSGGGTKTGHDATDLDITWPALASKVVIPVSTTSSGVSLMALMVFAQGSLTATEVEQANIWMAANPGFLFPGWAGRP